MQHFGSEGGKQNCEAFSEFKYITIKKKKKKKDKAFLCATSLVTFTDMNAICPKARRGNVHFLVKIFFLTSALKILHQINKE